MPEAKIQVRAHRLPLGQNHLYFVLVDKDGNVIRELHGVAVDENGKEKAIGWPTDNLKFRYRSSKAFPDDDDAVVKTIPLESLDQGMKAFDRVRDELGPAINGMGLRYKLDERNSNTAFDAIARFLGVDLKSSRGFLGPDVEGYEAPGYGSPDIQDKLPQGFPQGILFLKKGDASPWDGLDRLPVFARFRVPADVPTRFGPSVASKLTDFDRRALELASAISSGTASDLSGPVPLTPQTSTSPSRYLRPSASWPGSDGWRGSIDATWLFNPTGAGRDLDPTGARDARPVSAVTQAVQPLGGLLSAMDEPPAAHTPDEREYGGLLALLDHGDAHATPASGAARALLPRRQDDRVAFVPLPVWRGLLF